MHAHVQRLSLATVASCGWTVGTTLRRPAYFKQLRSSAAPRQQFRPLSGSPLQQRSWQLHASQPEDLYSRIPSQGVHTEPEEYAGPQLQRLDINEAGLGGTSDGTFGTLAAVLVGFTQEQFEKFREIMIDMEADIVKMIPATSAMLEGTLEQAVDAPVPLFEQLPANTRRAIILSGMSTEEVMEVISYYKDTESLPETLWGAAVPKNYDRILKSLMAEMYDDHDYMRAQEAAGMQ